MDYTVADIQRRQRRLESQRAASSPELEPVHLAADLHSVFSQLRQKRTGRRYGGRLALLNGLSKK